MYYFYYNSCFEVDGHLGYNRYSFNAGYREREKEEGLFRSDAWHVALTSRATAFVSHRQGCSHGAMPSSDGASGVRIEEISAATFDGARLVMWCIRFSCCPTSESEFLSQFEGQYSEALKTTAVAVRESDGVVIGAIKTAVHGQARPAAERGMHETRPGECYVDWLAVSSSARGKGVGTKLLRWADQLALSRGCNVLTLGVMNGNPAVRLYERHGFVVKRESLCEAFLGCIFISCFIGCPNGKLGGKQMEKPLTSPLRGDCVV